MPRSIGVFFILHPRKKKERERERKAGRGGGGGGGLKGSAKYLHDP